MPGTPALRRNLYYTESSRTTHVTRVTPDGEERGAVESHRGIVGRLRDKGHGDWRGASTS